MVACATEGTARQGAECCDRPGRDGHLFFGSFPNLAALGHGEKGSEQSEVEIVWIHRIPLGGARSPRLM